MQNLFCPGVRWCSLTDIQKIQRFKIYNDYFFSTFFSYSVVLFLREIELLGSVLVLFYTFPCITQVSIYYNKFWEITQVENETLHNICVELLIQASLG